MSLLANYTLPMRRWRPGTGTKRSSLRLSKYLKTLSPARMWTEVWLLSRWRKRWRLSWCWYTESYPSLSHPQESQVELATVWVRRVAIRTLADIAYISLRKSSALRIQCLLWYLLSYSLIVRCPAPPSPLPIAGRGHCINISCIQQTHRNVWNLHLM